MTRTDVQARNHDGVGLADRRVELVAHGAILALAAFLRLGNLAARGSFDADQGHDMLVLRALVFDGRIPLLGPPTSIGDFHHGMLYYLLLAPAAAVSHADPVAVTTWIALGGVAAVAVTGWLARSIAGPIAGMLAALLLAVSSSAIEESIFIWNPNLIALSSSIALAAAWHAWRRRRPRWWVVAGAAAVVTMQCHVLAVILTPVIGGLLVADVRRRRAENDRGGSAAVVRAALTWLVIGIVSYVPLAIHEIGNNASELHAALAFIGGGGGPAAIALPARIPIVGLRVLGWPLAGLITSAPVATILAAVTVVGLAIWRGWIVRDDADPVAAGDPAAAAGPDDERLAVRWLALGLAWTVLALAIGASSLATVVAGLPNDHYHAFADPMVIVLAAVGFAGLARSGARLARRGTIAIRAGGLAAAVVVVALVGWNLANEPPAVAADGGWAAARAAAARVLASKDNSDPSFILWSLPAFKSDEALRMPLEAAGARVGSISQGVSTRLTETRVVMCDELFRDAIGADCGGPAEDVLFGDGSTPPPLIDRFEAAPGRWISVYGR